MKFADLKEYCTLEGRRRRMSFFLVTLALNVGAALCYAVFGLLPDAVEIVPNLAVMVVSVAASICVTAQRLHDLGVSAWWMLLSVVPLVNLAFFVWIFMWPGDPEGNTFGPAPADGKRHVPAE